MLYQYCICPCDPSLTRPKITIQIIKEELELIKRTGESRNAKKVMEAYFKLSDTYHEIMSNVKGVMKQVVLQKEKIVNAIENAKEFIPVEKAVKIFNISRATYHNYKTLVINKCDASYFLWCVKQYPNQLLKKEIFQIKNYMETKLIHIGLNLPFI